MILKDEVLHTGGYVIKFLALSFCINLWFIWVLFPAIEGERKKKKDQSRVDEEAVSPTLPVPAAGTKSLRLLNCSHLKPQSWQWKIRALRVPEVFYPFWNSGVGVPNSWDISPYFSKDMIVFNLHGNQTIQTSGSQSQNLEYNLFYSEPNFPFRAWLPWHLKTILSHPSNPLD